MSTSPEHVRQDWPDIPAALRGQIDEFLGSPVVDWSTPRGGFSPGPALRVITDNGVRAFIKAIGSDLNPDSIEIHRREAKVASALPGSVPIAGFQAFLEADGWVALLLDDVEGRHPLTPWRPDELRAVLNALVDLTVKPVPAELRQILQPAESELAYPLSGWMRNPSNGALPADLPADLRAWIEARLPALIAASERGVQAAKGDCLLHNDLRADNILIRPDGEAVLVDWPWASYGAGWLDALYLLINVRYFDPQADVESIIDTHPVFADMGADEATDALIGLAGYFIDAASGPPPPGIPTLRKFQLDQGIATLRWIMNRMGH